MKPHLPSVTLCAIDTTPKARLAVRAIEKCLEQAEFGAVKLLTHDCEHPYAVRIPELKGLEAYSNFMVRELWKHFTTSHCLVTQWDGYVTNGEAWTDEFLKYDYIGAPTWTPQRWVGNGGFSLRSRRLCEAISKMEPELSAHPEDAFICLRHRVALQSMGFKFAPNDLADRLSFEGRAYDGIEWRGTQNFYAGSFGFHSYLSRLPFKDRPRVYHHSGEWGDVLYSLPVIASKGDGVLFLSEDNKFPYPRPTREKASPKWVDNIKPLLEVQPYIWRAQFTHGTPPSTDFDLNRFRLPWKEHSARDNDSILKLHCDAFGVKWDETQPWLTVDEVWPVPGRPICVSRSARYHNDAFGWDKLVARYGEKMFFIGTEQEAHIFQGFGAPNLEIPWMPAANLLEAARYIAGAKVFLGNQSSPLAIAHGLCKNCVVEEWQGNPNCRMNRPNAIYSIEGKKFAVEIPEDWLK